MHPDALAMHGHARWSGFHAECVGYGGVQRPRPPAVPCFDLTLRNARLEPASIVLYSSGAVAFHAEPWRCEWSASIPGALSGAGVRLACRRFLEPYARGVSDLDDVELIAAELVANVMRHANGSATFSLGWRGHHAVLLVIDGGPGFPALPASSLEKPFEESGRGLALVGALSRDLELGNREEGGAYVAVTLHSRRAPSL